MSITMKTVSSGYDLSTINANFQTIQSYVNGILLHRAGSVAGEGMMQRDLDMNGNKILNADIDASDITDSRAIRVPVGEPSLAPLPVANDRKGKVLSFDINTGLPIVVAPASGSAVDVLNQLATGNGASLVGYTNPNLTGSSVRTVRSRLAEKNSALDVAMVGNNSTDNTAKLAQAIADVGQTGTLDIPSSGKVEVDKYRVNSVSNPYGIPFTGNGHVVIPQGVGGIRLAQYPQDYSQMHIGSEYLYRMYQKLVPGQGDVNGTLKIVLFGDSTVAGGNGESAPFFLQTFLTNQLAKMGIPNAAVTNAGVGGTTVQDWNPTPYVTSDYDVFIVKYGINDGGNGRSDRLEYFTTTLRSKLAAIRAVTAGNLINKTIILVGPNSTNDTPNNRDANWYTQLRNVYIQAARDFQCAFYDSFSMMPDSYNLAGTMMDDPFGNGIGVHPRDNHIAIMWGAILDRYFNKASISQFVCNNFVHGGAVSGVPTATTGASSYQYGINFYRATPAAGWPIDGSVVTIRHVDSPTIQMIFGTGASSASAQRTWNIATNTWNVWTGIAQGLTVATGWNAVRTPTYRVSDNGLVTVNAELVVTTGSTASGTTVLSGIPSAYLPAAGDYRFAVANTNGTFTSVGINSAGNIFLSGSTTSGAGVHINFSYYV